MSPHTQRDCIPCDVAGVVLCHGSTPGGTDGHAREIPVFVSGSTVVVGRADVLQTLVAEEVIADEAGEVVLVAGGSRPVGRCRPGW